MAEQGSLSKLFGSFNRMFWVVNFFELFERGAYYSMMAILSIHVVNNILGGGAYASTVFGILYGFVVILLYFYPVVSGALAEKYGYRNMLLFAFSVLIVGYMLMSMARPGQFVFFAVAYSLVGLGAGTFKPIVSATIAHVTSVDQRNQAYSIYYWLINFGAFVGTLVIGFLFSAPSLYHLIFVVSGALVCVNMAMLLLFFRNPVEPRKGLSVVDAIKRIGPALKDRSFVMLLVIYSGFWFMYTYQTFIQIYMDQFDRMPDWFAIAWISTVNPGTIIVVGPFISKAVAPYRSMSVMMTGISLACIGIAINGLSDSSSLFLLGIVIFSVGEFITHPGFISYVSKIAPTDKLAIYMASIFISVGIGQIAGGVAQGFMYDIIARGMLRPKLYIALIVAVGLATLIAFLYYNRWLSREARRIEPTIADITPSVWTRSATVGVVLLLIPATIGTGFALGTSVMGSEDVEDHGLDWTKYASATLSIADISDYTNEGDEWSGPVEIGVPNVASMTFTLTWTDEADDGARYTNQPDTFILYVTPPNGTEMMSGAVSNPQGGAGTASVSFRFEGTSDPFLNGTGAWDVVVKCTTAGNQVPRVNFLGLRTRADAGNAWTLSVECVHLERPAK